MLTERDIEQFFKDVNSLGLKKRNAALVEATKYSKGNVSDFMRRKKPIPENFIKKFYEMFGGSLKVPPDDRDYLSGANLANFLDAHKNIIEMNMMLIGRDQPKNQLNQEVVALIREAVSGKKQMTFDELIKLLDKAGAINTGNK